MVKLYTIPLLKQTVPDSFIVASMQPNFRKMAEWCGIKLQIDGYFDQIPVQSGIVPVSYNLLQQWVNTNDTEVRKRIIYLSEKQDYWIFNEFYIQINYVDPFAGLPSSIVEHKVTNGIYVDPIRILL